MGPLHTVYCVGGMADLEGLVKEVAGLAGAGRPRRSRRSRRRRRPTGRARGKRRSRPYTKGELNKLIDDLVHPYARDQKGYYVLDGILHGIVERDPNVSMRKFIKHNLPRMLNDGS